MARDGKKFGLTPVDDEARTPRTVIRLESEGAVSRRIEAPPQDAPVAMRLDLPERDDGTMRITPPPASEALIDGYIPLSELTAPDWAPDSRPRRWPWAVAAIAAAFLWYLIPDSPPQPASPSPSHAKDAELAMIDQIESTIRGFFMAGDIAALLAKVRHPDRVRPLMEDYYKDHPVFTSPLATIGLLEPIELGGQTGFWMGTVELRNHEKRNVLVEVSGDGSARIDWETLVCYQPMAWDDFARSMPDKSFEFRVNMEPENFLVHDGPDINKWSCFRLTAPDSEETVFGYAERGSDTENLLRGTINRNDGARTAVILQLRPMTGNDPRKGAKIEKLVAPRWIFLNPPNTHR